MYKFDVKYTFDNYYEYYKYTLIKSRIVKDLFFCLVFFGFAAYLFVDQSPETSDALAIFSIILGVLFPLMNFATLPILKKQLKAKQRDIDNTRIFVTFTEEEVIYQNLTVKPEETVKVEETPVEDKEAHVIDDELVTEETSVEEIVAEEVVTVEVIAEEAVAEEVVTEELPAEETVAEEVVTEEAPVEEAVVEEVVTEEAPVEEVEEDITVECDDEKTFKLSYKNFMSVKETENLLLFYLDKRTVVILPKSTLLGKKTVAEFKEFVKTKINRSRVKFSNK